MLMKSPQYQVSRKFAPSGSRADTCLQTDRGKDVTKLIVAFCDYANAHRDCIGACSSRVCEDVCVFDLIYFLFDFCHFLSCYFQAK